MFIANANRNKKKSGNVTTMRNSWTFLLTGIIATAALAGTPGGGKIDTAAGTGARGYAGDGGPATKARLDQPVHCELDGSGFLYVAEAGNHCIRKIDLTTGIISTAAGSGQK